MKTTHHLPKFRYAVVGAGAVGLFYGGKLAARGRDVHFLLRSDFDFVRKQGIRIESKEGDICLPKVNAYRTAGEIGPVDAVIIGLKATGNMDLPALVEGLQGEQTWLIVLQNGIGVEACLAERCRTDRVAGACCFVCLNRAAPGVVRHLGEGRITLGDYAGYPRPFLHDLAWEFKRCGVPCRVVLSLEKARWEKLMWNIPFNGLCITAGCDSVADLLADPPQVASVRALMEETRMAAAAAGHLIPAEFPDRLIAATRKMGAYRPSSLIDFQLGRPVEVEAIWGAALRRGQATGCLMPELEKLYRALRLVTEAAEASA